MDELDERKKEEAARLGLNNYTELSKAKRIWFFKCPECQRINYKLHDIRSSFGNKFVKHASRGCYKCGHLLDYDQDRIGDTREYHEDDLIATKIEGQTDKGFPKIQAYIWTLCVDCSEWHYLPLEHNRILFGECPCKAEAKAEAQKPVIAEPYGKELEPLTSKLLEVRPKPEITIMPTCKPKGKTYICKILVDGTPCGKEVAERGRAMHEIMKHGRTPVTGSAFRAKYREVETPKPSLMDSLLENYKPEVAAAAITASGSLRELKFEVAEDMYTELAKTAFESDLSKSEICSAALKEYLEKRR